MRGKSPPGSHCVALHPLCGEHPATPPTVMLTEVSIRFSLPEPLSISMFASSGISHAHTFTLFECSLSNDPLSAKKHEKGSVMYCYSLERVQRGYCSALVTC